MVVPSRRRPFTLIVIGVYSPCCVGEVLALSAGVLQDRPQPGPLLDQDAFLLLCETEILHRGSVLPQPGAVRLVGREARERNERMGDVVGALMRHEIAEQVAAI